MLVKKILVISTLVILSCGSASIAQACENKFGGVAMGNLEKSDLDRLKKRYRNTSMQIERDNKLNVFDVKGILGFSGEQTKTANNGSVEDWIWVDRENCKRKIKASFRDGELMKIKSYGF